MRRRALHLACLFTEGHAVCTYRDHHPRPIVTCCNLPLFILSILLVPVHKFALTLKYSRGDLEVPREVVGVVEVDGSPRGRGYRWLCRARGVWRRGGSGEASVAAGGRAAAPGRVQVDDAPALDAVGQKTPVYKWGARRHR